MLLFCGNEDECIGVSGNYHQYRLAPLFEPGVLCRERQVHRAIVVRLKARLSKEVGGQLSQCLKRAHG